MASLNVAEVTQSSLLFKSVPETQVYKETCVNVSVYMCVQVCEGRQGIHLMADKW